MRTKRNFSLMTYPSSNLENGIGSCQIVKLFPSIATTKVRKQFITKSLHETHAVFLAVYIDSKLTFKDHIIRIVKNLNEYCGLTFRFRNVYLMKCSILFYDSYATSSGCYGHLGCRRAAKANLEKN